MNVRILATLLMAATPAMAEAETFTFKGEFKPVATVLPSTPPGERPSGGFVVQGHEETTDASGKKTRNSGQCIEWHLPPGDPFWLRAVCKYSDASGEVAVSHFNCDPPGPASVCFGRITGTGGAYKGRVGAVVFETSSGYPSGVGFWKEPPPAK